MDDADIDRIARRMLQLFLDTPLGLGESLTANVGDAIVHDATSHAEVKVDDRDAEIERLREALRTCQCLAQGDRHATYIDRCVAIDVHVHLALHGAAGGDDE